MPSRAFRTGIGVYYLCMFTTAREDFEQMHPELRPRHSSASSNTSPSYAKKMAAISIGDWLGCMATRPPAPPWKQAHLSQFLALLRTPLPQLWDEIQQAAETHQVKAEEYVRELQQLGQALVPPATGGGSHRHFSSVLQALSALAAPVAVPPRRAA